MANFDIAVRYVLENEGGFSNDPNDHGGATNFGIIQSELSEWRGRPVSVADVKNMSVDEAKRIYHFNYWLKLSCDKIISQGVATAIFDMGVNLGIGKSAHFAQTICINEGFKLKLDNDLGVKTAGAINMIPATKFILEFMGLVKDRYLSIVQNDPSQNVFLHGWLNRTNRLASLIEAPKQEVLS